MLNHEQKIRIPLLDHGYVELVDIWGSDEMIVETARQSTQKGFEGWGPRCGECGSVFIQSEYTAPYCGSGLDPYHSPAYCKECSSKNVKPGDEKLLKFLSEHHHDTPFEFAGAHVRLEAPIVVLREWQRHRTQSYSEASARYAPLPEKDYSPTVVRMLLNAQQGGANKQAGAIKGAETLDIQTAQEWMLELERLRRELERHYQAGLQAGVPKELARLSMTVGRYSRMSAIANLRNWAHFLTLRLDPAAQWEIRQYANAVRELITPYFPRTIDLLVAAAPR